MQVVRLKEIEQRAWCKAIDRLSSRFAFVVVANEYGGDVKDESGNVDGSMAVKRTSPPSASTEVTALLCCLRHLS